MSALKLRVDHFAEWRASGSDLPFEVWMRERQELTRARQQPPVTRGTVPEWAIVSAIVVTCLTITAGIIGRAAGIW